MQKMTLVCGSYFKDRWVCVKNSREEVWKKVSRGCPQGSIGGPSLWNLSMNGMLNELTEMNDVNVCAFADDVAILAEGGSRMDVEKMIDEKMKIVYKWGRKMGVDVSEEKTVCMLLKGTYGTKGRSVKIDVSENVVKRVKYVSSFKYLGVKVTERMGFKEHVMGMKDRVARGVQKLKRVLRKTWGLKRTASHLVIKGAFLPQVTYCASAWYECLKYDYARNAVNSAMRCAMYACLNVCKTVSTEAMQVLLGWLPWDLECLKRANVYKVRKKLRMNDMDVVTNEEMETDGYRNLEVKIDERLYEKWQDRWNDSRNGRVTAKFVGDVRFAGRTREFEPRLKVGYILTGHGTLNAFLHERGLSISAACMCGDDCEDWEHVLCKCGMYEEFRDLDAMGIRIGANDQFDFSGVLSSKMTYVRMCEFVERAYKMRESIKRRMAEELEVMDEVPLQ